MPIASGWFLVSQMLTVAQRFFTDASWRVAVSAPASGPLAASAAATGTSEAARMRVRERCMP
jgi:hypothetical protein